MSTPAIQATYDGLVEKGNEDMELNMMIWSITNAKTFTEVIPGITLMV